MSDTENFVWKANRILVALDTSARGQAALEAAVRLAANTSAELQGLFVEDEDLVRLASLPFAREVDFASAALHELHSLNMERALRAAAEETHQAFTHALQQLNLRWTFRIVRGTIAQASLAAAGDVDLLVIGQQGRSPRIMAGDFFRKPSRNRQRVVGVFDGSPSACRTLECASRLATLNGKPLAVLVLAALGDQATRQCMSWLQEHDIRAEVDQVLNPSENAIVEFVRKWPPGVLLINRDSEFVKDAQICRMVNEMDCPLILC